MLPDEIRRVDKVNFRARAILSDYYRFIQQMNAVKEEFEKQRQRDLNEMQQVYSKDAARQLQALYNQLEVCHCCRPTHNLVLSCWVPLDIIVFRCCLGKGQVNGDFE